LILYLGNRAWEIEHEKSVTVYGGAAVGEYSVVTALSLRKRKSDENKILDIFQNKD